MADWDIRPSYNDGPYRQTIMDMIAEILALALKRDGAALPIAAIADNIYRVGYEVGYEARRDEAEGWGN